MGPLNPVEIEFVTSSALEDAGKLILATLSSSGGKIKIHTTNDIVAGFGSGIKMRLLGAAIVGVKTSPRDVVVSLKRVENHTLIKVSVRDTFGMGSRVGFTDKLQSLMWENAISLKSAFTDVDV